MAHALALSALGAGCNSIAGIEQAELDSGEGGRSGKGGLAIEAPKYDAQSSTWCEEAQAKLPNLEFCADFDRESAGDGEREPGPGGFSAAETSPGMTLALSSARPATRWNDLLVYAPPNEGFGTFAAKATKLFAGRSANRFTLTFDFYPEEVTDAPGAVALIAVVEFVKGDPYSLRLVSTGGKLRLEESRLAGLDVVHESTSFDLELEAWTRIELDVALGTGGGEGGEGGAGGEGALTTPGRARVSTGPGGGPPASGGLTPVGDEIALAVPAGLVREDPQLLMGVAFGTLPHAGWKLRYDNVMLDLGLDRPPPDEARAR